MLDNLPHILLIDDNRAGIAARRVLLERSGYAVETAAGGREGIDLFERGPFDLVVTDYRMPDVSGAEVVRAVRDRNPSVPVVILSGYAANLGLTEADTGADAVLSKGPSEEADLVRAVARLVKRKPGAERATPAARAASRAAGR